MPLPSGADSLHSSLPSQNLHPADSFSTTRCRPGDSPVRTCRSISSPRASTEMFRGGEVNKLLQTYRIIRYTYNPDMTSLVGHILDS